MEAEVLRSEMVVAAALPFKRIPMTDKYPKGQSRGRYWKHLKQILQAETFRPDEPNYLNIESAPSVYPPKTYCDLTGYETPYVDPRTNLCYGNPEVFKQARMLPNDQVQKYLALRNAAVYLK